jgi:hypothetical protein
MITAFVGVSFPRQQALTLAKQPIPAPTQIRALVDTGASCTFVDPAVLSGLGLTPTGSASVNTGSTGATPHQSDQYDVSLYIPGVSGQAPYTMPTIPVVALPLLAGPGYHALIGRDILRDCIFSYNGTVGFFSLAY